MIVMIIIAALMYIMAGVLLISNIYIMDNVSDENREWKEATSLKNIYKITFLLIIGAILGIIWTVCLHISGLICFGILLGSFFIGVFIRIIIHKKRS